MKKLDYELTSKMFGCSTREEIDEMYKAGADFATASRLAIDEVLSKVFNRTCTGTKDLAVQMIIGELLGQFVADVADDNVSMEKNGEDIVRLTPEERFERINARVEEVISKLATNDSVLVKKVMKDAELVLLATSEIDILSVSQGAPTANRVLCLDEGRSRYYFVRNTEASIKMVKDWGDKIVSTI